MSYHTREAFEARMASRRANPVRPDPVRFFYHAALMPGWRAVVGEQLRVLAASGVDRVVSYVLGSAADRDEFVAAAAARGVAVELAGHAEDFGLCEGPTIVALYKWARDNPSGASFYFHTKGVSVPHDAHKRQWRRVMGRYVVAEWRRNLDELAVADVLGCAWQPSRDYPHFCGNFWAARNDWLANLPDPEAYPKSRPDFRWAGTHSWRKRMWCETWLGSAPWHHVRDRIGHGVALWADAVWGYPGTVHGVDYADTAPGRFSHSGALGDLIFQLPVIEALGGGHLSCYPLTRPTEVLTPDRYAALKPLLEAQSYITGTSWTQRPDPDGLDLDGWRGAYRHGLNLTDMACDWARVPRPDRRRPWLRAESNPVAPVVFHRSVRYHNPQFPWKRVVEAYPDAVFVGLPAEHAVFTARFGPVPYYPTRDLLELAGVIAGARLFVGNQSCPRAVAEGLKIPVVVEAAAEIDNNYWDRPGAWFGYGGHCHLPSLDEAEAYRPGGGPYRDWLPRNYP